ncbi:LppU/SCO3897 family protein [Trujillonella endophytica]|uniref:Uncharacterized protein n=1 Tax=Trujillonella endophytica TaxID=673521 RepID=A0A1H8W8A4_9ACTN|nr:hypothetical protein [Trujillella endophytica]SEP23871.1 hypothetical protein SAMN05660991_04185 [Trujillella endophytica]
MTTPGSHGPHDPSGGGAPGWGQPPAGSPGGYSPPPPPPPGGATPPPPGGFGQGQPQQGQPYPPQGQPYPPQGQPYPQQGQPYPPQGQPYPPQGGAPGQPWAPQKSGRPKWLIPVVAAVVAVLALGGLYWFLTTPQFDVDDCLHQEGANEFEEVDCDDSDAQARIIGVHDEELTESEFYSDNSTCSEFPETVGQIWVPNTIGDDGTIYCTVPIG